MPNYPYSFQLPPLNVQDIPNDGVAGEFLGISAGGVLDWLPVAGGGGGGDMLKADNLSGLADYAIARTNIGLGTTSTPTFANLTLTSPSLTSDAPVTISQTWNNAAVAFTGLKFNAAGTSGTNSSAASLLLDLQVGGLSKAYVDKNGAIYGTGVASGLAFKTWVNASQVYQVDLVGTGLIFAGYPGQFYLPASSFMGWNSNDVGSGSVDTKLFRDGAPNTLALRNGANTQTFNVYGSYGSISDYKRLSISCDQTTGNATITNQAAGYTAGTVSINGVPVGLGKGNVSTNVAVGDGALNANTTGLLNVSIGKNSARLITGTNADANTVVGSQALYSAGINTNTITAIGCNSFYNLLSGSYSIVMGQNAASNVTSATSSIFIGSRTTASAASSSNEIVIGESAIGIGSNSVVLGNDSITKTALKGNVGIGTTAPGAKLDLVVTGNAAAIKVRNTDTPTGNQQAWIDLGFSDSRRFIISAAGDIIGDSKYNGFNYINSLGKPFTIVENNVNVITASSGNVGIGTTAPTTPLSIQASPAGNVLNVIGIGSFGNFLFQVGGVYGANLLSVGNASTEGFIIGTDGSSTDTGSVFRMQTKGIVRSVIDRNGNFGIGTTSPTSKLHVVGDAVLTGDLLGTNYTIGVPTILTQSNISITNTHSGVADSAIVITPKGVGAFIVGPKPDGTVTGGNARGTRAVDLSTLRTNAANVASGDYAVIGGGYNHISSAVFTTVCGGTDNSATSQRATVTGGQNNTASSNFAFVGGGQSNIASNVWTTIAGGLANVATAAYASILGGHFGLADRHGLNAIASGRFASDGDAQNTKAVFRNKTTTNTAVELFLDGSSARYTVTSGKIISMLINITGTKSDGSAVAHYVRQYSIKNIGGTTSQVYAAVTVGTDNAAGTSIAISADDTNNSLKIEVTGVAAETWRWVASVDAVEVGHGV